MLLEAKSCSKKCIIERPPDEQSVNVIRPKQNSKVSSGVYSTVNKFIIFIPIVLIRTCKL